MIVSLSVSNFRSFSSEETFSLVASKRLGGSHRDHEVPIPDSDECVLRTAVLYGANGAGKSNLFRALRFVRTAALHARGKNKGTGRQPFRFGSNVEGTSSFDLQFIADGRLYRFGFKVDDEKIVEEWLLHVQGNRERTIYERITDEKGSVRIDAVGLKDAGEKLRALTTVGGPANQSFLATVNVTLASSEYGSELTPVLNWFKEGLTLVGPESTVTSLASMLAENEDFRDFATKFLRFSSTGVDSLNVLKAELPEREIKALLPEPVMTHVLKDLSEREDDSAVVELEPGTELLIENKDGHKFYRITISSVHQTPEGKEVPLELNQESDGTKRLLNLMPALHDLRDNSATYFIDEIDRSLHPILVLKFLEFFLESCKGAQRQIIFTTHESSFLNLDLLRRDEIWFAEKDQASSTRLYSLADFKVRTDLELRKHYLQGRFGAVPFLGNLDQLLHQEHCAE